MVFGRMYQSVAVRREDTHLYFRSSDAAHKEPENRRCAAQRYGQCLGAVNGGQSAAARIEVEDLDGRGVGETVRVAHQPVEGGE